MSAGTWCPVQVDREAQFATDAEEESQRSETIFDAAARHCNERVWCVGGEDAGEELEVFMFMFEDMVVQLRSDDAGRMFFKHPRALWGEKVVRKYWARSVRGMVGGQDDVTIFGRM